MVASRNAGTVLNFASHPFCLPLAELEGKVSPLVTDEVLLNHLPSGKHIFRGAFLEAHSHCTNTYIAVSRPETADETVTSGTDKSVPYERPLAAAES